MANVKHLQILLQGVGPWNHWRENNRTVQPDLTQADLRQVIFSGADMSGVNLNGADLRGVDLRGVGFTKAELNGADLSGADLSSAFLVATHFRVAFLRGVSLRNAHLQSAEFFQTGLDGADFTDATMGYTTLVDVNLGIANGLATVKHDGPSSIGVDTLYLSGGKIPEVFLRGAGVPEAFIAQIKSLVAAMSPIEFYSCFISYSSKDQEFATRLYADLRNEGVRCWFAPEDLKIGDKLRSAFDEAIRVYDKLMVLLSEHSVSSPWVEKEVETAFERERREKRTVLFPIRLDDAVMETDQAWAADIRRTRHIGDFRDWKNHDSYKKAFERLLRDLKAEG